MLGRCLALTTGAVRRPSYIVCSFPTFVSQLRGFSAGERKVVAFLSRKYVFAVCRLDLSGLHVSRSSEIHIRRLNTENLLSAISGWVPRLPAVVIRWQKYIFHHPRPFPVLHPILITHSSTSHT
jgi:hypothetical protein